MSQNGCSDPYSHVLDCNLLAGCHRPIGGLRQRRAPTGGCTRGDGDCESRGIADAIGISRANRPGNRGTHRTADNRARTRRPGNRGTD